MLHISFILLCKRLCEGRGRMYCSAVAHVTHPGTLSERAGSVCNVFVWNGLNKVLRVVLRPLWRLLYYRDRNKRREIFNWLRRKKYSIYLLQELHCVETTTNSWAAECRIITLAFRFTVFFLIPKEDSLSATLRPQKKS